MADTEIAWAAGFFEGEGGVYAHRHGKDRQYRALRLVVSQTDPRPLQRLAALFGGRVGPITAGDSHVNGRPVTRYRQLWRWYLGGRSRVIAAMDAMLPYLSEPMRERWAVVLEECPANRAYRIGTSRTTTAAASRQS